MDEDLHVHHDEALKPAAALTKVGDALPGLGIVAAVLGIVITMGHIDGPPRRSATTSARRWSARSSAFSCRTASASRSPRASKQRVDERAVLLHLHQGRPAGRLQGHPPAIAVEFARRVLPHDVRPTFNETEQFCKAAGKAGKADDRRWPHDAQDQGTADHHHQEERRTAKPATTAARGRWPTPTS